jgi:hypothetical protein
MIRGVMGYENRYAIDTMGNIYSFPNKTHKNIKAVKPRLMNTGYHAVALCKDNTIKYKTVHRIMAECFLGNVDGLVVNHKNGIRSDNRLENLEVVTPSENALHGVYVLKNGKSKLTHEQAQEIKSRVAAGEKQKHIATEFGVSPQIINYLVKGKTYNKSDIVDKYKD